MKIGDILYYAQISKELQLFEVLELKVRTIDETNPNDKWFVGIEPHSKHAYLFGFKRLNDIVFENRADALEKVISAEEKYKRNDKMEIEYEEY